ncbi:hypothetical protein EWM64_g9989 [Hericium alpestre]|uniref:Transcription activator GCR1-like domain-containing protein n=1 Tax=Hericium alpestre TaxID=135208 RepID=A0A4Y9ZJF9_9AGAM|nr:hypothetical protein EWM64_g9989 [Hericium alpestre]
MPLDALLASAMFNGQQPSSYFLARNVLEPPGDLLCLLFPWVEQEQRALAVRMQQSCLAIDIALESFLKVLLWFRRVLLQDAAILYCRNSTYPIFNLPPFNSQAFRNFAEGSMQTMQGVTTEWALQLQQERMESRACHNDLTERMSQFMAEVQMQNGTHSSRKQCRVSGATVSTTAAATSTSMVAVVPGASAPAFAPMHAEQPALPGAAFPTTHLAAPAFGIALPPPPPLPVTSVQPELWLPSNPLPSTMPDARWKKQEELQQQFGDRCITQHPWQLVSGIYVPTYVMQPATAIEDIWTEYTVGLNGFLPVRELEEQFRPKWRGNVSSVKTEWGRRKKIIALIQKLSSKARWDVDLVLRFLRTEYAIYNGRKFSEYLQNTKLNAEAEILERARSFT